MKILQNALSRAQIRDRMTLPQGYRLLQGFPSRTLMNDGSNINREYKERIRDENKELIVGVIPIPYCSPKIKGCGFCTFPHQKYNPKLADTLLNTVEQEIDNRASQLGIKGRKVSSIYLGGGTANRVSASKLAPIYLTLDDTFNIQESELTLEGVPSYFLRKDAELLSSLVDAPVKKKRLSMGVQTFDTKWIEKMGRSHFGDAKIIEKVVAESHKRDISTSGDFLINLPGQNRADMLQDIDHAMEIGLDQICVYNLVIFDGIGSEWSKDPEMMSKVPSNEVAFENWRSVRQKLLESGFVQTTLTNFERADSERFLYENLSYTPQQVDIAGFGPAGITILSDKYTGSKTINQSNDQNYLDSPSSAEKHFRYGYNDLTLMKLTRNFSRGFVDISDFNAGSLYPFANTLEALSNEGLLVGSDSGRISLTEKGMFYADTVLSTLAKKRANDIIKKDRRDSLIDQLASGWEKLKPKRKKRNNNDDGHIGGMM